MHCLSGRCPIHSDSCLIALKSKNRTKVGLSCRVMRQIGLVAKWLDQLEPKKERIKRSFVYSTSLPV
jgi:hypothetical protein